MGKILLVDDDSDMLLLTERWLKKAGHEVDTALTGQEALEKARSNAYDLILLDYGLPDMDGPAVLNSLRREPKLKDIPVIFRTGMEDGESDAIMDELSPQGVIKKSEGKSALIAAVSGILG